MCLPPRNPLVKHQLVTIIPSQVFPTLVVMFMVKMVLMRVVNEMIQRERTIVMREKQKKRA